MSKDTEELREAARLMHERAEGATWWPWHPPVALAVADWLDGVALHLEAREDDEWVDLDGDPIAPEDTHAIGSALTVARAYLGGGGEMNYEPRHPHGPSESCVPACPRFCGAWTTREVLASYIATQTGTGMPTPPPADRCDPEPEDYAIADEWLATTRRGSGR